VFFYAFQSWYDGKKEWVQLSTVRYSVQEGVLQIELNRPHVRNAINFAMMEELEAVLNRGVKDEKVHVILLRGSGDRAFAAGGDLVEFHPIKTEADAYSMLSRMGGILNQIAACPKLTIAAINGVALGGGAELTTAFDIRLAVQGASIGFVQRNLGLTTGWGGGTRLIRILGVERALPLLISGSVLPVEAWKEMGYIYQVYSSDSFNEEVERFARECAALPTGVLAGYKAMARRGTKEEELLKAIEEEIRLCAKLWGEEAHLQAVKQFISRKQTNS
jgi:enoyl-CoA hydratase